MSVIIGLAGLALIGLLLAGAAAYSWLTTNVDSYQGQSDR